MIRLLCRLSLTGIGRCQRATAAIEFALVGPLFILLILGIAELGLYYGKRAAIDHAVQSGARVVRVGYVEGVRTDRAAFEDALCGSLILVDCGDISYSVDAQATLSSADFEPRLNNAGDLTGALFELGDPSDIVIVTAATKHGFITPFGGAFLGDSGGTSLDMIAHIVIKNEPFPL